jgi:AraC-like DNA-binding protein
MAIGSILTDNVSTLFDGLMREGRRYCDVADARDQIARAFLPHHWTVLDGQAGFELHHREINLGAMSINAVSYNRSMLIATPAFEDFLCVHFSTGGECSYHLDDYAASAGEGVVYVSSPQDRFEQRMSPSYKQITLKIQRSAIEQFVSLELGRRLIDPVTFSKAPQKINGQSASALHLLEYFCREYSASQQGMEMAPLAKIYAERTMLATLLAALPNNYQEACRGEVPTIVPYYVKRVMSFIDEHLRDEICLDMLVEASGVSRRSVSEGFRRYCGMSPMAYLKQQRLLLARRELSRAAFNGRTVTDVVFSCGFNHLSKFSSDYARQFGEAPSVTRRVAREAY